MKTCDLCWKCYREGTLCHCLTEGMIEEMKPAFYEAFARGNLATGLLYEYMTGRAKMTFGECQKKCPYELERFIGESLE